MVQILLRYFKELGEERSITEGPMRYLISINIVCLLISLLLEDDTFRSEGTGYAESLEYRRVQYTDSQYSVRYTYPRRKVLSAAQLMRKFVDVAQI